jgi:hypothetical protein
LKGETLDGFANAIGSRQAAEFKESAGGGALRTQITLLVEISSWRVSLAVHRTAKSGVGCRPKPDSGNSLVD